MFLRLEIACIYTLKVSLRLPHLAHPRRAFPQTSSTVCFIPTR